MEEQINFIQAQIDRANSNLDEVKGFFRYRRESEDKETQAIAEMLSVITGLVSNQQALIESMFNLLKAKIN